MNLFMGRRLVGSGGGKEDQRPEVVFNNKGESDKRIKRMLRSVKIVTVVAVLTIAASGSFYTLSENETVVLTTFGRPNSITTPGPKFKVPLIQEVHKVSEGAKGIPIGYDSDYNAQNHTDSENGPITVSFESEMITKDFSLVSVDFYIEYQIVDPVKAYIHSDTAIPVLKNLAQPCIRDTVGSYNVDEIITAGKSETQARMKALLFERLGQKGIDLGINNVTTRDAQLPTDAVNNASRTVEGAKQGMDTKINEARGYQSGWLPAASAGADEAARDTEAYRRQRISEAEGQIFKLDSTYREYIKYPLITKKRMFYEAIGGIPPRLRVIINGSDGTQIILPLNSFTSETQSNAGSPAGSYNNQINQPDQTGRTNQAGASSGSQSGSYDQEELYEGND